MSRIRNSVSVAVVLAAVVGLSARHVRADVIASYTPVDHPSPGSHTSISGFSDGKAVGHYFPGSGADHGFIYDGGTFTDLDYPPGPEVGQTFPTDIAADRVVGYHYTGPKGFEYNTAKSAFTPIAHPDGGNVQIEGTDGARHVGYRTGTGKGAATGFLYEGGTWTDLNKPGAGFTNVTGVEGQTVVGYYTLPGDPGFNPHGFTHVLGSGEWTTVDFPGSVLTRILDIDDGRLVGEYATDTRMSGFLYERGTWTSLDIAGSINTSITGIDGDQIAGTYFINPSRIQSFIATVPEPAVVGLMSVAAIASLRRRRCRRGKT